MKTTRRAFDRFKVTARQTGALCGTVTVTGGIEPPSEPPSEPQPDPEPAPEPEPDPAPRSGNVRLLAGGAVALVLVLVAATA